MSIWTIPVIPLWPFLELPRGQPFWRKPDSCQGMEGSQWVFWFDLLSCRSFELENWMSTKSPKHRKDFLKIIRNLGARDWMAGKSGTQTHPGLKLEDETRNWSANSRKILNMLPWKDSSFRKPESSNITIGLLPWGLPKHTILCSQPRRFVFTKRSNSPVAWTLEGNFVPTKQLAGDLRETFKTYDSCSWFNEWKASSNCILYIQFTDV